jgi:hypothetical protein
MKKMNPSCSNFVVPQMRQTPWSSIFKPTVNSDAIDLVSKLLVYVPDTRLKAIDVSYFIILNLLYFYLLIYLLIKL